MFARIAVLFAAAVMLTAPTRGYRPPVAPSVEELLRVCEEKDGWDDPAPPARLDGRVYYVGTCGITVLLVASPQGHILLDSGTETGAQLVLANIRRLGLNPRDVRWIVASHTHHDHVGGLAALQAATGALVAALPAQAAQLSSGTLPPDDPQYGLVEGFTPVSVARVLQEGVPLRLGGNQVTAFATPGHTAGSTSWVIRGCGRRHCPAVTYADSVSPVSADGYRFTDHPEWVAAFRGGMAKIAGLPCSILVTPHPSQSTLFERFAGDAPLSNPQACAFYANWGNRRLDERLAREREAQ